MNRIYSLVWNRALRVLQVASEIARPAQGGGAAGDGRSTQGAGLKVLTLAIAAALALQVTPAAWACRRLNVVPAHGAQPAPDVVGRTASAGVNSWRAMPALQSDGATWRTMLALQDPSTDALGGVQPMLARGDACGGGGTSPPPPPPPPAGYGAGGTGGYGGGGYDATGKTWDSAGNGAAGAAGGSGTNGTGGAGGAGGAVDAVTVAKAGGYHYGAAGGAGTAGTGSGGGGGGGGGGAGYLWASTLNLGFVSFFGGAGGVGGAAGDAKAGAGMGGDGGAGLLLNLNDSGVQASVSTEQGGAGGAGGSSSGGTGGRGGYGGSGIALLGSSLDLGAYDTVTGGAGGAGGSGSTQGNGGGGGYGVLLASQTDAGGTSHASSLIVGSGVTITGGAGGAGATTGAGGAGIVALGNASITLAGNVSGGLSGDGSAQADAIDLAGGGNTLTLEAGYQLVGNVYSGSGTTNGGDTLALGGSTDGIFAISSLAKTAPASWTGTPEFYGFNTYEKTGSSTWVLNGAPSDLLLVPDQRWIVQDGVLQIGDGTLSGLFDLPGMGGAPAVDVTGGTLQVKGAAVSGFSYVGGVNPASGGAGNGFTAVELGSSTTMNVAGIIDAGGYKFSSAVYGGMGATMSGTGGNGGAAVAGTGFTLNNAGYIWGGGAGNGAIGGTGGAGVSGSHFTLNNSGNINTKYGAPNRLGGIGGSSYDASQVGGTGGYGVGGSYFTVNNTSTGTIAGGSGGGTVEGYNGGDGGNAITGTHFQVTNAGTIIGGYGYQGYTSQAGGNGANGGNGGNGGAGVYGSHFTVVNSGSITGGAGGYEGFGYAAAGGHAGIPGGAGAGIVSHGDSTVINEGTISGGKNADGSYADAIEFTGGGNTLELIAGKTATFNGAIDVTRTTGEAADTLELGGASGSGTFDLSQLASTGIFGGFNAEEKSGGSMWTLTGTGASENWGVTGGTLDIGDGTTAASITAGPGVNPAIAATDGVVDITSTGAVYGLAGSGSAGSDPGVNDGGAGGTAGGGTGVSPPPPPSGPIRKRLDVLAHTSAFGTVALGGVQPMITKIGGGGTSPPPPPPPAGSNGAGGAGGAGAYGASLATGGEGAGGSGGAGGTGTGAGAGGTGGGGGGLGLYVAASGSSNAGHVDGGAGAAGNPGTATSGSYNGGAGGGGGGGAGAWLEGAITFTNSGTIAGGAGGDGGVGTYGGGAGGGGGGGAAVLLDNGGAGNTGATFTNTGTVTGGAGGLNGGSTSTGAYGGAGVYSNGGATVINEGTISGGKNADGSYADAIDFTGGGNTLELVAGKTATFNGAISVTRTTGEAADTFELGGASGSGTFDVSNLSASTATTSFNALEKSGASTWTLTGAGQSGQNWTITGGTLQGDTATFTGNLTFAPASGATASVVFDEGSSNHNTPQSTSGTFSGTLAGKGTVTKTDNGTLTLSGANTSFTGGITVAGGTLEVGNASALGSGALTLDAGTTLGFTTSGWSFANVLYLSGDPTFNLTANQTETWTGTIADGTSHGALALDGAAGSLLILDPASASTFFSGGTTIDGGTLEAQASGALGGGAVTVDDSAGDGSTLQVDSGVTLGNRVNLDHGGALDNAGALTEPVEGGADGAIVRNAGSIDSDVMLASSAVNTVELTAGGVITGVLNAGTNTGSTLTLDGDNATPQLYSDAVQGATTFDGALTKAGSGEWIIDNDALASVFGATISGGTLQLGNDSTTGSIGAGAIIDNAALVFDYSDDVSVSNALSGTGAVTKLQDNTLTYTGGSNGVNWTVAAGTLDVGDGVTAGDIVGSDGGNGGNGSTSHAGGAGGAGNVAVTGDTGTTLDIKAESLITASLIAGGAGGVGGAGGDGTFGLSSGNISSDGGSGGAGGRGGAGVSTSGSLALAAGGGVYGGDGGAGGIGGTGGVGGGFGGSGGNGGLGGKGGAGLVDNGYSTTVDGTITGGNGGVGGTAGNANYLNGPAGSGGDGGKGGAGVTGSGFTLTVNGDGVIHGGAGGAGGVGGYGVNYPHGVNGADGAGGVGVNGTGGATVITSGAISGGLSGDGTTRADAIDFTGGGNTLTLESGYQFVGNVISDGSGDTLELGGDTSPTHAFAVSAIAGGTSAPAWNGTSTQYYGFSQYVKSGASTWTLTGTTAATTPWTLDAGTLSVSADGNLGDDSGLLTFDGGTLEDTASFTLARDVGFTGDGTFDVDTGTTLTASGTLSGTGALTKTGSGMLTLTGANSFSGGTTVSDGVLQIGGTAGTIGNVDVASGAELKFDRSNAYAFDGQISGSGSVVTAGGRLTFNGDSSGFDGGTSVEGNTLVVGDTGGDDAALGGNVDVSDTGTLGALAGFGSIGGNVELYGAVLAPGNGNGSIGTLTIGGDLQLDSGSLLDFDFGVAGTSDNASVTDTLTFNGSSTLNINQVGSMGAGLYNLFDYGTLATTNCSFSGGAACITLGALPNGVAASTLNIVNDAAASQINLYDTAGQTLNIWAPNGAATPGGSGTWSASSQTWTDVAGDGPFKLSPQPGFAIFEGTQPDGTACATTACVVTVDDSAGAVSVTGLQFAVGGYELKGATASDALTLVADANGNAPTINVGDGNSDSAGMTATIDVALAGTDGFTKTDYGTLVLDAANTYTGAITVDGGTLEVAVNGALSADGVTVDDSARANATLQVDSGVTLANHITLNNGATLDNAGVLDDAVDADAVQSDAGIATVNNTGSISGNDLGIDLQHGGTVNNAGTGSNIRASRFYAVQILGGIGNVSNTNGAVIAGKQDGVALYAGGSVSNTGSSITGSSGVGVAISGDTGTVDNATGGTITGNGTGVALFDGGTVTNDGAGSTINAAGAADGTNGVQVSGASGTVVNSDGASITSSQIGVALFDGGEVDNGADSTISGATLGVFAGATYGANDPTGNSGAVTLRNAGAIVGGVQLDTNFANTVELTAGGSITGDLDIGSDTSSTLTLDGDAGTSQLYSKAVTGATTFAGALTKAGGGTWVIGGNQLAGVTGTTISDGTLQVGNGTADGSIGNGAIADDGSLVFDRSDVVTYTGVISGTGALTQQGVGTLTLTGDNTFTGGTTISAGILQIGDGGTSGSVAGAITDNATLVFDRSDSVTYAGAVAGSGALIQQGAGTLILTGTNTYGGGTTISAGTLQVGDGGTSGTLGTGPIDDDATLVFDRSDAVALPAGLTGSGALIQQGSGTFTVNGNDSGFAGTTTIEAGTAIVGDDAHGSANLGGDVTVAKGATLGGIGTIGGMDLFGSLSPGGSIGTLHVAGAATFEAGSIFNVEANPDGQADRLAVTGATTIKGGNTLVIAQPGDWAPRTNYTVITAGGGVRGAFDSVSDDQAFLTPVLSYEPDAVELSLERNDISFPSVAGTPNAKGAATGENGLGWNSDLYNALVKLSATDAQVAFNQTSGEFHASQQTARVEDSRFVREAMNQRLRQGDADTEAASIEGTRLTAWAHAWGHWGTTDGDGNAAKLADNGDGLLIGADMPVGAGRVGVTGGASRDSLSIDARDSWGRETSTWLGAFAGYDADAFGLRAGVAYAWDEIPVTRQIVFPGYADRVSGNAAGDTLTGFVEGAWKFRFTRGTLAPFVNLAHTRVETDASAEAGGSAALHIDSASMDTTFATVGARGEISLAHHLELRGELGWRHAFGDVTPASAEQFVAGGAAFTVYGVPVAQNAGLGRIGLDWRASRHVAVDADYEGLFGGGVRDNAAKVSVSITF